MEETAERERANMESGIKLNVNNRFGSRVKRVLPIPQKDDTE